MSTPLRIAFLASHRGTNMQAILDAVARGELPVEPVLVISNNQNSGALERGARYGLLAVHLSRKELGGEEQYDQTMCAILQEQEIDLIVLAGYMQKIGPKVLQAYQRRILNIHPSLLPRHGGKGMFGAHVHQAVLAAGDTVTGVTVHLIDAEYDSGPILAQREVPVTQGDTAETLAQRVLAVEHQLYREVLAAIANGSITLDSV